ncbi:MAG: response regulator [Phycisphaeraceae bacterium]|nr:response regulator [Phycisphaeraceae bacterium]MBX3405201.1 response regulator [Phycisphaeraceae bacterium]
MAATHVPPQSPIEHAEIESKLTGLRVLVVEDSFLAAASISRMLSDLGCRVVGPVASVDKAVPLIEAGRCDAGVLDINLAGQTSEPIAERLAELKLPYLFVTGYASPMLLSAKQRAHTRIHKPIAERELRDALVSALQKSG